jgi:Conserved protein/domain typically associated with flavoprotein oxygenases, DIM6/NTAB family
MEKVMIGKKMVGAAPVVIAGAIVDGKANYITLGGFGLISLAPPIVYITLAKSHYTNVGIKENGYFSVNVPSSDLVQKTDYVGLVSGRDNDKSDVFTPFFGSVDKAPMIRECHVNMLCKVIDQIDLPNNDVFLGEILEVYVSGDCLMDGKPDVKKINPLILAGGLYFELGNIVGTAYRDGKSYSHHFK